MVEILLILRQTQNNHFAYQLKGKLSIMSTDMIQIRIVCTLESFSALTSVSTGSVTTDLMKGADLGTTQGGVTLFLVTEFAFPTQQTTKTKLMTSANYLQIHKCNDVSRQFIDIIDTQTTMMTSSDNLKTSTDSSQTPKIKIMTSEVPSSWPVNNFYNIFQVRFKIYNSWCVRLNFCRGNPKL